MSRYRLLPTAEQSVVLAEHCRHARFVWNLAVEQQPHWQPGRRAPVYNEQCAQLTAVRADYGVKAHLVQGLNRRFGRVWVPKLGWVRFRLSRPVPEDAGPCNADVNAARNIAAGRAATARGELGVSRSANREPQPCSAAAEVGRG